MTEKSRLDRAYARLLCNHPYGWALYKKVTMRDIFPGSCGYFDPEGDWCTLVNLMDQPKNLVSQGWKTPNAGINSTRGPESMTWGPKHSTSVNSKRVSGTAGTTTGVAPCQASATLSFESKGDQAAVLATENPVLRHGIGDERSALQWVIENKTKMLRQHGDVLKRHGIWIITKTYSTHRCAVALMTKKSSSVEIGLNMNLEGAFTLTPESSWANSSGSSSMELHEDDKDGVVVFISGIYFSKKVFSSGISYARDPEKQKNKIFRGSEDDDDATELDIHFYPPLDEDEDNYDVDNDEDGW